MNGLIRQYFPKGTNFDQVTDEEVAEAVFVKILVTFFTQPCL